MLTRERVLPVIEELARESAMRLIERSGLEVADLTHVVRSLESTTTTAVRSGARSLDSRRQLAQTWAVLAAIHANLLAGSKMTQRELWYRVKPTGLFTGGPTQVNERVLDAAAVVSARSGEPCPREALGVMAAPRGSMTGCITLLAPADGANAVQSQSLRHGVVYQVSDPSASCLPARTQESMRAFRRVTLASL